jgi:hypothetical protein
MHKHYYGIIALLLTLANAGEARAGGWAGNEDGFAVLPGITIGGALYHSQLDSPGIFIGGEVSAWLYNLSGLNGAHDGYTPSAGGGYIDTLWDLGSSSLRVSAGPGLAWWFVGIDGGLLLQRHNSLMGYGATGRLFFSALVPGLFVRVGKTWGDVDDTFVELGLTLKFPILPNLL